MTAPPPQPAATCAPPEDRDCPRCRGGGCEWCHNTGRAHALMPVSDVEELDAVVHELAIEDSHQTSAEALRVLHAEIAALRRQLAEALFDRETLVRAVEFGSYLANAADRFMENVNERDQGTAHPDDITETWSALLSAIHEFRTRRSRAALAKASS